MNHQQHDFQEQPPVDAGRHFARLRHVQKMVEQIAGREGPDEDAALDESARIAAAYADASPVTQRLFDTLVAETSGWASTGLDALASVKDPGRQPHVAAARLADALDDMLNGISKLLRP